MADGQGRLADLLGRQHAVEARVIGRALGEQGLGRRRIAPGPGRAAPPVIGPADGDRGLGHLLDHGEMLLGQGRIVQALQGDPAGIELRLRQVGAGMEAGRRRGGIGPLIVAAADQGQHQGPALRPDEGRGIRLVGDIGRKGAHQSRGDHVQVLAAVIARPVEGEAGVSLQCFGNPLHILGRVGPLCPERHARLGKGAVIAVHQIEHGPRRRALLAVEQRRQPRQMILRREQGSEPGQHTGLQIDLEDVFAPVVPDDVRGVLRPVDRLQRTGQGHGPLRRVRVPAVEPGDHRLGRQARRLDGPFRAGLSALAARPAGHVPAAGVQGGEIHLGRGIVDQGPEHDLALQRVGQAGHGPVGRHRIPGAGRVDRIPEAEMDGTDRGQGGGRFRRLRRVADRSHGPVGRHRRGVGFGGRCRRCRCRRRGRGRGNVPREQAGIGHRIGPDHGQTQGPLKDRRGDQGHGQGAGQPRSDDFALAAALHGLLLRTRSPVSDHSAM